MTLLAVAQVLLTAAIFSLVNGACFQYGCTPQNTFSQDFQMPMENVTLLFSRNDSLPVSHERGQGCVSTDLHSYCPVDVPGEGRSYVDLDYFGNQVIVTNMTLPSLPVILDDLDAFGSDGIDLNQIRNDNIVGNPAPIDPPLGKVYSSKMTSAGNIVIVSLKGKIVIYSKERRLLASYTIKGKVGSVAGTYAPVCTPAVNDERIYMITQFLPDDVTIQNITEYQVHAVDVSPSKPNGVGVAWNYTFAVLPDATLQEFKTKWIQTADVLWFRGKVFANFIYPFVLNDLPNKGEYFAVYPIPLKHIVANGVYANMKPGDPSARGPVNRTNAVIGVGATMNNSKIVTPPEVYEGMIAALDFQKNKGPGFILDVSQLVGAKVNITSKVNIMSDSKTPITHEDMVFGVSVSNKTQVFRDLVKKYGLDPSGTNFIVAIRASYQTYTGAILWIVTSPENARLKGQIIGVQRNGHSFLLGYAYDETSNRGLYYGVGTMQ